VRSCLPPAQKIVQDAGLAVPLITTALTSSNDPAAASTFETAASCGIPEIKLGYVQYGAFGTFRATMDQMARELDGIEKIAEKTGVRANLHIHSGDHMTALAPVVWWLIKDRSPEAIGAYVDPGHMMVEGARDGWRMGLDLLGPRITLVAVKDLAWEKFDDAELGKPQWRSRIVPLRQGMVPWPAVFECLRQLGFDGWVSVHSEYQGRHAWRDLTVPELLEQTREDVIYLREVMVKSC
jgi:sugar phosphate isomerase/epimerase